MFSISIAIVGIVAATVATIAILEPYPNAFSIIASLGLSNGILYFIIHASIHSPKAEHE